MTPHTRALRNTTCAAVAIVLASAAASAFVLWRVDHILGTAFSMLASTAFSLL